MPDNPLPADCQRRFEFQRPLGSGGFGCVYLAIQTEFKRPVAIKLLTSNGVYNLEATQRFANEARVAAALAHPNIVRLLDASLEGQQPWIAYEYVDGPTVRELLQAGPVGVERALTIARHVAGALQAAHDLGIVHRDIKPENVLLDPHGHYRVTDFGIAKWNRPGAVRTGTGIIVASPYYAAPEQITADRADGRTDLYALGIMLFEMLAGRPPFQAPSAVEVLHQQLRSVAPSLRSMVPTVPPALDRLVGRCLEKDPDRRPGSAAEFVKILAACGETTNAIRTEISPRGPVLTRLAGVGPTRRRLLFPAAVVGVLLGSLLTVRLAWHRTSAPIRTPAPPDRELQDLATTVGQLVSSRPDSGRVDRIREVCSRLDALGPWLEDPRSPTSALSSAGETGLNLYYFCLKGKRASFSAQLERHFARLYQHRPCLETRFIYVVACGMRGQLDMYRRELKAFLLELDRRIADDPASASSHIRMGRRALAPLILSGKWLEVWESTALLTAHLRLGERGASRDSANVAEWISLAIECQGSTIGPLGRLNFHWKRTRTMSPDRVALVRDLAAASLDHGGMLVRLPGPELTRTSFAKQVLLVWQEGKSRDPLLAERVEEQVRKWTLQYPESWVPVYIGALIAKTTTPERFDEFFKNPYARDASALPLLWNSVHKLRARPIDPATAPNDTMRGWVNVHVDFFRSAKRVVPHLVSLEAPMSVDELSVQLTRWTRYAEQPIPRATRVAVCAALDRAWNAYPPPGTAQRGHR
jgi:serine/threonine protein kinase